MRKKVDFVSRSVPTGRCSSLAVSGEGRWKHELCNLYSNWSHFTHYWNFRPRLILHPSSRLKPGYVAGWDKLGQPAVRQPIIEVMMDRKRVDVGQSCEDRGGCGASTERREEASERRNESKHAVDVWEHSRARKNQRQPDNFANKYRYRKKMLFVRLLPAWHVCATELQHTGAAG